MSEEPREVLSGIQPVHNRRLSDQIASQLRELIIQGRLKPGDRLPSERDLCTLFEVSRPVIREALSLLQHSGIIDIRQGSGTYVTDRIGEALSSPVESHLFGELENLIGLMELRMGLETEAAGLAAQRATPDEIKALENALQAMADAVARGDLGTDPDVAFHYGISRATHNVAFTKVMNLVSDVFWKGVRISRERSRNFVGRPQYVLEEHRRIFEAIKNRDSAAARKAMREHLEGALQRLVDEKGERIR